MKAKFFSKVTLLSALLVMIIAVVAGCGGEQQADLLCQRLGQHQAQPQHHHTDDAAEPQQVPL